MNADRGSGDNSVRTQLTHSPASEVMATRRISLMMMMAIGLGKFAGVQQNHTHAHKLVPRSVNITVAAWRRRR